MIRGLEVWGLGFGARTLCQGSSENEALLPRSPIDIHPEP